MKRYSYVLLAGFVLLIGGIFVLSPYAVGDAMTTPGNLTSPAEDLLTDEESDTATQQPGTSSIRFRERSESVGLNYTYFRKSDQSFNDNAGVYTADYDNDGWMDLLAVGGKRPILFQNDDGTFSRSDSFPRINESIVVQSALFFDYDGDGWVDLLLLPKDRSPRLLENDHGTFSRVDDAGFNRSLNNSIGATAGDYNNDGCMDVFVIQYGEFAERKPNGLDSSDVPIDADNGNPNVLYRGDCSSFERVDDAGIRGDHWTLATSFVDLNGDGWTDIHVGNDFTNDLIYLNQRNGTFDRRVLDQKTDRDAMSSEIGDVNHDGRPDIFVTNIWFPEQDRKEFTNAMTERSLGHNLLINRGNGSFEDRAEEYGIRKGGWAWAAVLADFDNDMDRDLFYTTLKVPFENDPAFSSDRASFLTINYSFYTFPVIAERTSDGFARLDPYPDAAGFNVTDGRGVARADFDRDGDLDLAVGNGPMGKFEGYAFYENVADGGNAIQLRVATTEGTTALGATVNVTTGGATQLRWVTARSDYFSQDSRRLHIGTGGYETVDRITVVWPDGTERTIENVAVDQSLTVYPNGTVSSRPLADG